MLSVRFVSFVFSVSKLGFLIEKMNGYLTKNLIHNYINLMNNYIKMRSYIQETNNQLIASYCRGPNKK